MGIESTRWIEAVPTAQMTLSQALDAVYDGRCVLIVEDDHGDYRVVRPEIVLPIEQPASP